MRIECVWEHNGSDTLLYAANVIGAYTRGASKEAALAKMPAEAAAFWRWQGVTENAADAVIVQEKPSALRIVDADSDVLFAAETRPLTQSEYERQKQLALRSARDFQALYSSVPDKTRSVLPARETFYGPVPRTAEEMYRHTRSVNPYYFGEIGVDADAGGTIPACRARGFAALEKQPGFLQNDVRIGSCGELWCLRKVLRRFLWHDRIHAKAMYRMAAAAFGRGVVPDLFRFEG